MGTKNCQHIVGDKVEHLSFKNNEIRDKKFGKEYCKTISPGNRITYLSAVASPHKA